MVSSWRAAGVVPDDIAEVAPVMTAMGQKPFSAPSPKGWPETAGDWCAPDAIMKRMAWSEALAAQSAADRDPDVVADECARSAPHARGGARRSAGPKPRRRACPSF